MLGCALCGVKSIVRRTCLKSENCQSSSMDQWIKFILVSFFFFLSYLHSNHCQDLIMRKLSGCVTFSLYFLLFSCFFFQELTPLFGSFLVSCVLRCFDFNYFCSFLLNTITFSFSSNHSASLLRLTSFIFNSFL